MERNLDEIEGHRDRFHSSVSVSPLILLQEAELFSYAGRVEYFGLREFGNNEYRYGGIFFIDFIIYKQRIFLRLEYFSKASNFE